LRGAVQVDPLSVHSCLIDGEAIVVATTGLSVFDLIRYRQHDRAAILCAFDLIELDGKDIRSTPLEERWPGLRFPAQYVLHSTQCTAIYPRTRPVGRHPIPRHPAARPEA
jgi:ATP-dependent DNA ligase